MSLTYSALFGNFFISLILGSVFYNLPDTTDSFFSREVLLFYAVLLAAFASALEV
jgi:ATP-binding cassette subfamily G (WHITE) protein 2 (PDR)